MVPTSYRATAPYHNDYCLLTTILLPDSSALHIVNVYIPPATSIPGMEEEACRQLNLALDHCGVGSRVVLVGDLNAHVAEHVQ